MADPIFPQRHVAVFAVRTTQHSEILITFEKGLGRGAELKLEPFTMPLHRYVEESGDGALAVAAARELAMMFDAMEVDVWAEHIEVIVMDEFDIIELDNLDETMLRSAFKLVATNSAMALSDDRTKFVIRTTGSSGKILIGFDNKRQATAWSMWAQFADDMEETFIHEARDAKIQVIALKAMPEWSGEVPQALVDAAFGRLEEQLETFEGDDYEEVLEDVRWATRDWFWGPFQETLEDPFVRITDVELYDEACDAPVAFSAGDDARLEQLITWIVELDAFADEDEVDYGEGLFESPYYEGAFLTALSDDNRQNIEIQAAYRDKPAVALVNGAMSERCRELINAVTAWAAPRGTALKRYIGNRSSMAKTGPARRLYAYTFVQPSAHEHLAAIGALSEFLASRNYDATEIDRLLYPPQKDKPTA